MRRTTVKKKHLQTICPRFPLPADICATREFSLLNDAQKSALGSVGTQVSGALQNGIQGMMTQYPQLAQNPQFMALVQSLGNIDIATPLNGLGQSLVDAFRTDTRNMYAGALTLTQPLYMGGKIRAYNKITRYAEELARQQHNSGNFLFTDGML